MNKFLTWSAALAFTSLFSFSAAAQGIGVGTTTPNASAALDVTSTTQGLLLPRLTSVQRAAIANPATGLVVYQTDGNAGIYYYNGLGWLNSVTGEMPNSEGFAVSPVNQGVVTTLAGTAGVQGTTDGTGTAASFDRTTAIAIDNSGNIFVSDMAASIIRRITPAGVVTTYAGTAYTPGNTDGPLSSALFTGPAGMAFDASGNLYVCQLNNIIRKITPAGVVSTLAGTPTTPGSIGGADGTGTAATFSTPGAVAVDAAGNLFVADRLGHAIRRITPAGVVTTYAGLTGTSGSTDGPRLSARFFSPQALAFDAGGVLYVADRDNRIIRRITPAGVVSTFAGTLGTTGNVDGTGTAAKFGTLNGIAIDASGNLYVTDGLYHNIRRITSSGVVTQLAGYSLNGSGFSGTTDGTGGAARFNSPQQLAITRDAVLYVPDNGNRIVRAVR